MVKQELTRVANFSRVNPSIAMLQCTKKFRAFDVEEIRKQYTYFPFLLTNRGCPREVCSLGLSLWWLALQSFVDCRDFGVDVGDGLFGGDVVDDDLLDGFGDDVGGEDLAGAG